MLVLESEQKLQSFESAHATSLQGDIINNLRKLKLKWNEIISAALGAEQFFILLKHKCEH